MVLFQSILLVIVFLLQKFTNPSAHREKCYFYNKSGTGDFLIKTRKGEYEVFIVECSHVPYD